ncbi:MAG: YifB family Mg chelatase-like AAA ATPase [Candidatus Nanopelagicales bacterium]|jgi:magnesium chelatase family protein|nr:YifB family Mg chelatase-like AAA ATPase [Candidatus Nanopelagicales bacterium]
MALARAHGVVIHGVQAHLVEVEAHLSSGLPGMSIVGLPDAAVGEARDRVRAAVLTSGARWPQARITVGLSPASLHKRGSGLDLAIASAVLAADGQLPAEAVASAVLFAELGLDGRVRPVRGTVVAAVAAARAGRGRLVVAAPSAAEAAVVPGLAVVGVTSLGQWSRVAVGAEPALDPPTDGAEARSAAPGHEGTRRPAAGEEPDLADVRGQAEAVAALEVAAVGGHHVAMIGRPGVGKTMLAQRLPTILPDLDDEDALTVTAIRSVVADVPGLVRRPPFQAPHHTATVPALVGGGRGGQPSPGAVTLAHGGVLLLDEAAEFGASCLEALRQPLESGTVTIARAGFTATMPARFQLVLAANPCPCGLGDGTGDACRCRSTDRRRYLARLSGPLLDRVDIRLALRAPGRSIWALDAVPETSAEVRARVVAARARGRARCARLDLPGLGNGEYPGGLLRGLLAPSPEATTLLGEAVAAGRLSARGADRALRVAWSVADLGAVARPGLPEVGRALALRDGGALDG